MSVRHDLFTYTINECRAGGLQDELSEALNECVQRARDTGKQAVLTLVLKISPNGATGQYRLSDEVKTRLPALDKGDSIFFGTPEGNLQRDDPRQRKLDIEAVSSDRPAQFEKAQ